MTKIRLRNEIVFRAPTRVGLLADVTERLYAKGINLLGIRAYDEGDNGVFLIYADDRQLAVEALELLPDGQVTSASIISAEVPNEPGSLAKISRALAHADINVLEVHATNTETPTTEIVIDTDDNIRAMAVLEKF